MEISSLLTPTPPSPTRPASATARRGDASSAVSRSSGGSASASASSSSGGTANLGAFQSVQQVMNNVPDTRADVVARGKALASSPTYPALEIIIKLAEIFVSDAAPTLGAE